LIDHLFEPDEDRITRQFPQLKPGTNCHITSGRTPEYNCLSWVLDVTTVWMQPNDEPGFYWPDDVEREWTLQAVTKILTLAGYEKEASNPDLEEGYEKIAIFLQGTGTPEHFARQLPNGKWTSKLGTGNDITHDQLEDLLPRYGALGPILRRQRS